jgi:hypothetical protein
VPSLGTSLPCTVTSLLLLPDPRLLRFHRPCAAAAAPLARARQLQRRLRSWAPLLFLCRPCTATPPSLTSACAPRQHSSAPVLPRAAPPERPRLRSRACLHARAEPRLRSLAPRAPPLTLPKPRLRPPLRLPRWRPHLRAREPAPAHAPPSSCCGRPLCPLLAWAAHVCPRRQRRAHVRARASACARSASELQPLRPSRCLVEERERLWR